MFRGGGRLPLTVAGHPLSMFFYVLGLITEYNGTGNFLIFVLLFTFDFLVLGFFFNNLPAGYAKHLILVKWLRH